VGIKPWAKLGIRRINIIKKGGGQRDGLYRITPRKKNHWEKRGGDVWDVGMVKSDV